MHYLISDLHINRNNFDSKRWEFTRRNLIEVLEYISWDITWENNSIIIWWDVFNDRIKDFRNWELWFAETIVKYSISISEKDKWFKVFIISWNHDAWNVLWENTALSWFEKYDSKRIEVIDNDLKTIKHWEINFVFAPFPFLHANRKKWKYQNILKEEVNSIKWKKVLISHFIITGSNWSNHNWTTTRNVFSTDKELLDLWFDYIILWDNHSPQDNDKIISIWSLEQTTFNEEWEEKSILLLTDKLTTSRVPLDNKTMYTFDVECMPHEDNLEKFIEEQYEILKKSSVNKNLRLRITLKEEDSESANKIKMIHDSFDRLRDNVLSYKFSVTFIDKKNKVILDDNFLEDFWNEEKMLKSILQKRHVNLKDSEIRIYLDASKNLMSVDKTVEDIIENIITNNK